jgi:hypothetical protein
MRTPRVIAFAFVVLAAATFIVSLALPKGSPPVSLTVLRLATNKWTAMNDELVGSSKYICATVELTNNSTRNISFRGWDQGEGWGPAPYSTLLYPTRKGWEDPFPPGGFGIGSREFKLAPSQAITFEVLIERDKPCKVALDFSDGRKPNRILQRLPRWIVQRLPWAKPLRRVTTDEIDLLSTRL